MFTKEEPQFGQLDMIENPNSTCKEDKYYWHIRAKLKNSIFINSLLFSEHDMTRAMLRTRNNIDLIQKKIEKKEKLTPAAYLFAYSLFITIAFVASLILN